MGFSDDIAKFCAKANTSMDTVVRKIVLDVGTALVEKTPVGDATYWQKPAPPGYVGGHARANWQHSVGSPKTNEVDGVDASGSATTSKIMESIPQKAAGTIHYVTNSVPYIEALEDGHSRQSPNGMVSLTVQEFQGIADKVAGGIK